MYSSAVLPAEFDLDYYRGSNPDLSGMDDATLYSHYSTHGIKEGRCASPAAVRSGFLASIDIASTTLEIGPFISPSLTGPNVTYADVLDQRRLNDRAKQLKLTGQAPYIEFVCPNGDMSIIDRTFHQVLSSHCIEHQPDLIWHLQQVANLLMPGGYYFLIVPDKRYCFDHFLPESSIAMILDSFYRRPEKHSLKSVVEHRALTTHNDCVRHWKGDHYDPKYFDSIATRSLSAIKEFESAGEKYIDVHAWQFTPHSFRVMIDQLFAMNLISFSPVRVYDTPRGRMEFCALLKLER